MQSTLGSSNELDGETIVNRFIRICEQLHLQRKDLLVCLRQEVATLAGEQVLILFSGESNPPNFAHAQKIPICFNNTIYGTLLIFSSEKAVQTALTYSKSLLIASICALILHFYELHWVAQEHARRNVAIQEGIVVSRSQFTKRQMEVLQLICQGYTKEQIMLELHITASTLQKHRQAIYNLLHVKSESDILTVAFQLRLFSPFEVLLEL